MFAFVSFGQDHKHPRTGTSLGDKYVVIHGRDLTEIRYVAFATFADQWCVLYPDTEPLPRMFREGLVTEIPLPEPCCGGLANCVSQYCPFTEERYVELVAGLDELGDQVLGGVLDRAKGGKGR